MTKKAAARRPAKPSHKKQVKPNKKAAGSAKKTPAGAARRKQPDRDQPRLYTLEVSLTGGLVTKKFVKKNPVVSRTIQIRGDQTLEDLHYAIFEAFDRFDEHLYEFQFGKRPMDPKAPRYVLPMGDEGFGIFDETPAAGYVDETTLDSLNLRVKRCFNYWFDFGDDWWHTVEVAAIEKTAPKGKFPKIINRIGKSPPQYL